MKRLKELLQTEKETILVVIEKTINDGMRRIMTERFGPERKSPYLQLRERSYRFEVEEDTGTGVAYTGLVLFDLTIFLLTRLPILVHDTVIFKNIENDSVSRLLPVYLETAKQSFIALDEWPRNHRAARQASGSSTRHEEPSLHQGLEKQWWEAENAVAVAAREASTSRLKRDLREALHGVIRSALARMKIDRK
jgi:hypothetical protein